MHPMFPSWNGSGEDCVESVDVTLRQGCAVEHSVLRKLVKRSLVQEIIVAGDQKDHCGEYYGYLFHGIHVFI